jgi:hypothetical protein
VQGPGENRGHPEGWGSFNPLRKIGLETPLVGRVWGENKKLVFSPPDWYTTLVALCLIGGALVGFGGIFGWRWVPYAATLWWVGFAVLFSGIWALLSMEYAVFDLRSRTFVRREGKGPIKRTRRGSLVDVDAVVLYAESYLGLSVIYRLVVHWKHARVPLLVTERQQTSVTPGGPLNQGAGAMAARGLAYAKLLGVAFYDNSYFHSPAPQSPI